MAAFFRGLLLFLLGALVGAGGILFFTPSFQVVVSRGDTAIKPAHLGAAKPVAVAAVAPKPPAKPEKAAQAVTPAGPAPQTASAAETALDFAFLSRNLNIWPTAVTTKAATTVAVIVDGKQAQELALEAGAVLQLTKVLADGNLEVRAKGAKFEIKSSLTDFTAELAKRVAELVSKGAKFDSPFPTATATATAAAAAPSPAPAPAAPVSVAKPKGPLTLEERVNVLFGKKPAEEAPPNVPDSTAKPAPAIVPASSPASPPVPAPPPPAAPTSDPKGDEKAKDLDRKINQLFK